MATLTEALAIALRFHQAGRFQAAEQIYRQILAAEPNHADALHLLGVLAYQAGRYDEAIAYINQAIALCGNMSAFHNNLGNALKDQGKPLEAAAAYRRVLELEPDHLPARNNLGLVLSSQGRPEEAVQCYRGVLDRAPDFVEAHYNLGNALTDQGKLDEAVASYHRALERKPDYAEVHNNLGTALLYQGKLDEAVACYCRALELRPDWPEAHYNLGTAFKDQGKLDAAASSYHRALEPRPDYAEAHLNRAFTWLLAGDWQRGWPEYEWRWRMKDYLARPLSQPLWCGEPLVGRTILLHAEQGLGDTIQFIRYAPLVKRLGATVVVECQKLLAGLLEGCAGVDRLIEQGDPLPAFDVHAPLLSVPGIFKTTTASIPAAVPYLHARPALVENWRVELSDLGGFRIGITWQGNPKFRRDRLRSIPLRFFSPLAEVPGVRLISLQKGAGSEQLAEFAGRAAVVELGSRLEHFQDTAAVMNNLDLVITSDTAAAHLAGALGIPVWVALSFAADWRWLLDRRDCPWYPTMRLFRQPTLGDWAAVFAEIRQALGQRIARLGPVKQ
jgi:tetratricopeptide (TPR) repeat protein